MRFKKILVNYWGAKKVLFVCPMLDNYDRLLQWHFVLLHYSLGLEDVVVGRHRSWHTNDPGSLFPQEQGRLLVLVFPELIKWKMLANYARLVDTSLA